MQRYLEIRTASSNNPASTADLARHLLTRQHLGKAAVICDRPAIYMSVARKNWLKLSRGLQKERASTLNAEKILQLTHDITHMQHMEFSSRPYQDAPDAAVFFATPDHIATLPPNCFSLYVMDGLNKEQLARLLGQLPERALVIDYMHQHIIANSPLLPKLHLEQLLSESWQQVEAFLLQRGVDIRALASGSHFAHLDEATDIALDAGRQFLRVSDDFLELLHLAQPLHDTNSKQQLYDLLTLLNRRVYALTPGTFNRQFTDLLHDDDAAFHDVATEDLALALAV